MGEFQTTNIKSRHYNYTIDYFELRAQPGRDTLTPGGDTYWYRDDINELLYPIFIGDAVVIGGTSLVSDELLRILGPINVTELRIGGTLIEQIGTDLVFYDPNAGQITLSSLLTGQWTRDDINGEIYPTILTDNVLIGLQDGGALRRLQVKAERNDNSSFIFFGTDSDGDASFSVTDQGDVYVRNLYFDPDTYMRYLTNGIQFNVDGSAVGQWSQASLTTPSAWKINSTGSIYYSRVGYNDGLGFPSANQVAIYIGGSPSYLFTASSFSLPQQNWITSGINMIRVNAAGQIELGNFTFDVSENKFYIDANTYISKDIAGNMIFYDDIVGVELSLSALIAQEYNFWQRNDITMEISPKISVDSLVLPYLAGASTKAVFVNTAGKLFSGDLLSIFTDDIPVVLATGKTLGKYVNGDTIPAAGLSVQQVLEDIATEYIDPLFTSFSVSGQATTVEVGTTISGSKTFTWAITENSGQVNVIDIYDITDASNIATDTANDGTEVVTVNTYQINSEGGTQQWRGIGTDENHDPIEDFNSSPFTITARYYRFYGPIDVTPADSAAVRALPSSEFQTGTDIFVLNTGTTEKKFSVCLPPGVTISEVVDLDALGQDITTEYVLLGTITVNDAGGTGRTYNQYEMNIAIPYDKNHRHQITAG